MERRERCCDQQVAVDVVAGVGHRDHGLLGRAVLAGEACIRADRAIVGGAHHAVRVAIGTESRAVHDDELGVHGPEILVRDTLACPGAALGRLEEDIGICEHLQEHFFAFGGELVECDRAAVAAFSLSCVLRIADRIAVTRVFEPGHVCAPVGHDVAGTRHCFFHGGEDDLHIIQDTEAWFFSWDCHEVPPCGFS